MIPQTWADVIPAIDDWLEPCVDAADLLKVAALDVATTGHIGYYYSPVIEKLAVHASPKTPDADVIRALKFASDFGYIKETPLTLEELDSEPWVKVAYSQTLKTIAENLNFIPGKYFGTIPNHPNPLAAMLTSGLVGAGLGYGAGKLIKTVAPEGYGDELPSSLAMLGGLTGTGAAGLLRAYPSLMEGKSLFSNWPHADPIDYSKFKPETEFPVSYPEDKPKKSMFGSMFGKLSFDLIHEKIAEFEEDAFGPASFSPRTPTPFDVNVDALGRTLWQTGASPQMMAGTLATMYSASHMPSDRRIPGYVTGDQLGKLAVNAAGNYATGFLAGYALNKVVGTPYTAPQFGLGNVALGVIGAVIPKIFGQ